MDACATYCWMPFETHVSINVDMCFQHFATFFFASLSLHLDFICCDYNESRFKTFWQTSTSLDCVVVLLHWEKMEWAKNKPSPNNCEFPSYSLMAFYCHLNGVVSWNAHDKLASRAIIIKSICDMQKVIFRNAHLRAMSFHYFDSFPLLSCSMLSSIANCFCHFS